MSIIRSLAKQRQLIETDENTEDISQSKSTGSGNNSIKRIFFFFFFANLSYCTRGSILSSHRVNERRIVMGFILKSFWPNKTKQSTFSLHRREIA